MLQHVRLKDLRGPWLCQASSWHCRCLQASCAVSYKLTFRLCWHVSCPQHHFLKSSFEGAFATLPALLDMVACHEQDVCNHVC